MIEVSKMIILLTARLFLLAARYGRETITHTPAWGGAVLIHTFLDIREFLDKVTNMGRDVFWEQNK